MNRNTARNPGLSPEKLAGLERCYQEVQAIILCRQNPITGLLPASTAINIHGDYTDAWVRDNVYSILAPWGLALAYRRANCDPGRTYLLEQSVVKLMRGLLTSMMRQAAKVETFKHTFNPMDALHAKYNTHTGDVVVADDAWGHLQLDATSLFLLMLAQMTASGLRIVFTLDEVNFVQNLVHYISRAYLTPDYGLWERGAKSNVGSAEINASSVGMAKAALEAMRGFDLFGEDGSSQASVIHVIEDDIANARDTLVALLPRESASKEIDAALLSIIGFPAYAIEDQLLVNNTRAEIVEKLQGRYGCKRFLRDGHQTVVEDHDRPYYETGELQAFEHIESEWPLFFTYLQLDGLMREDKSQADFYYRALQPLFVERDGQRLLPELYYVPTENIEGERSEPRSQHRNANDNVPLVWAQSLSILSDLLREEYLLPSDIDPLQRHRCESRIGKHRVTIALLAEDTSVQRRLKKMRIDAQTPQQIAPVKLALASALARAFCEVGKNNKLELSGRPMRALDTLTTSQLYRLHGEQVIFLPPFVHTRYSYFHLDNHFLVQQMRSEMVHVQRNWQRSEPPLLTLLITRSMLASAGAELLVALLQELQQGECDGVQIEIVKISKNLPPVSEESIDYLHGFSIRNSELATTDPGSSPLKSKPESSNRVAPALLSIWRSQRGDDELWQELAKNRNIYAQTELLTILWTRFDSLAPTPLGPSLRQLMEQLYLQAAERRTWGVMRRAAAQLGWYDERLEDELARLVIRGLRVAVGRSFSEQVVITRPLDNREIVHRINCFGGDDPRVRLLLQEIVLLLGKLTKINPAAFTHTYTLQCWHLLLLLNGELAWERSVTEDEAFEELLELNPQEILQRLQELLTNTNYSRSHLASIESLHIAHQNDAMVTIQFNRDYDPELDPSDSDWNGWRKSRGGLIRLSSEFCARLWQDLGQCHGLVIGDRLNSQGRLDSRIVRADMTPAERNFALLIEDKLNLIQAPDYRQLVIETLQVLSAIFQANPSLNINGFIVIDVVIALAVKIHWSGDSEPVDKQESNSNAEAWQRFFETPPHQVANAIVAAFNQLLEENAVTPV